MRTRRWLNKLLSGAVLLSGMEVANAQDMAAPPASSAGSYGAPPPNYDASTGWWFNGQQGGMPAGYPPEMTAWPNVSPFAGPPVEQHVNRNGFWFKDQIFGNRKTYFTVEGLISRTGIPNRQFIGATGVNGAVQPPTGGFFDDHGQQYFERPLNSTDGRPNRILDDDEYEGIQVFPAQRLGLIDSSLGSGGARATWGFTNPDFTGFEIQGFWQDEASGQGFLGTPSFNPTIAQDDYFAYFVKPFAGLPLAGPSYDGNSDGIPDGDYDGDGLPGTVVPFDIAYQLIFKSETYGASTDYYLAPIIKGDAIMIRPLIGARYTQVREEFQFNGIDSGMGYEINPPDTEPEPGSSPLGPTIPSGDADSAVPSFFYAHLRSRTKTHLAGPEAGIRMDLGGDSFKIWTQSKFSVLALMSERSVDGYNIGDPYNPTRFTTAGSTVQQGMPNDPSQTGFADAKKSTSIAPLFEQSIFVKAPIFSYIPGLKKVQLLEAAQFQAGYTLILIGNMQRPSDTIQWNAWPDNPKVKDGRSTFTTSNASFGIEWTY